MQYSRLKLAYLTLLFFLSLTSLLKAQANDELQLSQLASAVLYPEKAEVILNNTDSFASKLRFIENAQKEINLWYFIIVPDESTSYLAKKLLEKAHAGVKIRIITDYQYNYKNMDFFFMLEKKSRENNPTDGFIQVRLYGRPTSNMIQDVFYLTTHCPAYDQKNCVKRKTENINQKFENEGLASNLNNGFSGIFLSGLYAKDSEVLTWAFTKGQQVELSDLTQGTTNGSLKSMYKILNIYIKSKVGDLFQRIHNKIKLLTVKVFYGDDVTSLLDTLGKHTPFERSPTKETKRDWDFLTEYTHHKLLLVDNKYMQIGGRNIENSYHMPPNDFSTKYIFVDTDLALRFPSPGHGPLEVRESFMQMWNFKERVATLDDLKKHAPNDFLVNLQKAREVCKGKADKKACQRHFLSRSFQTLDERIEEWSELVDELAQDYAEYDRIGNKEKNRLTVSFKEFDRISLGNHRQQKAKLTSDQYAKFSVTYVENLPYLRSDSKTERIYGSKPFEESKSGKNIHQLIRQGLKRACRESLLQKTPKQVIFHQAYVMPTAEVIDALHKMINGKWDCSRVTVKFLSNSIFTTDLAIVSLFGRYALKPLFDYYFNYRHPRRSAKMLFYEYQSLGQDKNGRAHISLHSKVNVLGDDILIGSANLEPRSLMMDTNNGVYIRQASIFLKKYLRYIDRLLTSGHLKEVTRSLNQKSLGNLSYDTYVALKTLKLGLRLQDILRGQILSQAFQKGQGPLPPELLDLLVDNKLNEIRYEMVSVTSQAYHLIYEMMHSWNKSQPAQDYNYLFKPI